MPLSLDEKKAVVTEVAEVARRAFATVAAENRGLTVEQMTKLRVKARESQVYLRVIKNTLARRAFEDTDFACMATVLKGPLVYAFSQEDPGAAARVMRDFAKEHDKLVITVLAAGGQLIPPADIDKLAKMPTRNEALSLLMAAMRAPADKFARTVNEVPGKFVRTLAALREQKEAS